MDDYERRRRDLDDHFRRQDHMRRRHKENMHRSHEVHEGIRTGDHDRARRALGIPPSEASYGGATSEPAETQPQTPTADGQLRESRDRLLWQLQRGWAVPQQMRSRWHALLTGPHMQTLGGMQQTIQAIMAEWQQVNVQCRPSHFDITNGMQFINEMTAIQTELQWLQRIVLHIVNYQQTQGGRF